MKKTMLILGMSFITFGQSVAMSSDKVETTKATAEVKTEFANTYQSKHKHHKHNKTHKSNYVHKLVDIYVSDDASADKVGIVRFKERNNYSIFYCKESGWCELVNQKNGSTGWINLGDLKKSQEQYAKVMQQKANFEDLVKYIELQDQKIIQLQTVMMRMQKEFAGALQNQQAQIKQLQQSNYY